MHACAHVHKTHKHKFTKTMTESRADRLTGTKKVQHRAVIYIRPNNKTLPFILLYSHSLSTKFG